MTARQRKLRYGGAIAVALVGVVCGASISGTTGGTLATALIGLGLLGVISLLFYEVGLSEDRDRARAAKGAGKTEGVPRTEGGEGAAGRPPARLRPWRPDRMRGQRRRLR